VAGRVGLWLADAVDGLAPLVSGGRLSLAVVVGPTALTGMDSTRGVAYALRMKPFSLRALLWLELFVSG
jgi:hypothetical protein